MKSLKRAKQNLPAISIVESMVAMVLIVLSFGGGMTIFLQELTTDKITSKTKARVILNQLMTETKQHKKLIDETLEREGLVIEKKITAGDYPDLYQISLEALTPKNERIEAVREIIYLPSE